MTVRAQLFLLLTLAVLVVFAAVIGIIGFALARWDGAAIPASITRGASSSPPLSPWASP